MARILLCAVLEKRGKQAAFAGVFENPPLDTRQVMEPATYLAAEPQPQLNVAPLEKLLGPDWRREDFSGIGEIDLRVILRQWGGKEVAARLAPAWRGGYYMALANKKAAKDAPLPLALVLDFATPAEANQFASIYRAALAKRYNSVQPAESPDQWITERRPGAAFDRRRQGHRAGILHPGRCGHAARRACSRR